MKRKEVEGDILNEFIMNDKMGSRAKGMGSIRNIMEIVIMTEFTNDTCYFLRKQENTY